VVSNGDVKLLELGSGNSPTNAIINAVPDLFTKIQSMFSKKKKTTEEAGIIAEEEASAEEPELEEVEINTDGFDF
ncbi:MAG: hypothetical protein K2H90_06435, partial [Oscillospiraceae bacterium]|nr:hypothetical protein [Oscillospiraceae bacterium]